MTTMRNENTQHMHFNTDVKVKIESALISWTCHFDYEFAKLLHNKLGIDDRRKISNKRKMHGFL